MTPFAIGAFGIVSILVLSGAGVPIGIAIIAVATVGLWVGVGFDSAMMTLQTLPFAVSSNYTFVVVPMFVLMGNIAAHSGIVKELFEAANRWTAHIRGGLMMATTLASGGFAAISGSTIVNAAVFTRMALPEMLGRGYNRGVGAACIAAAGTFAVMIPPSLSFVVFGILTDTSIGALLIAGIIPGIVSAALYLAAVPVMLRFRPDWAPQVSERFTLVEKLSSLKGLWALIILIIVVLGGIYAGIMPPSAAGAVGAMGALSIALLRRKISGGDLWKALQQTVLMTSALYIIIIGGLEFSRFLIFMGFVNEMSDLIVNAGFTATTFMAALVLLYLVLGMFIDPISMKVLTLPIVFPVAVNLGIDPIWFAVILVKLTEIAVISPPLGMNLFTVVSASGGLVKIGEAYRGVTPFLMVDGFTLLLLIALPGMATWLPSIM